MFKLVIVVVDEQLDTDLMPELVLAERPRFAHQIGPTLASRVVELFTMRGFAGLLADRTMALDGKTAV